MPLILPFDRALMGTTYRFAPAGNQLILDDGLMILALQKILQPVLNFIAGVLQLAPDLFQFGAGAVQDFAVFINCPPDRRFNRLHNLRYVRFYSEYADRLADQSPGEIVWWLLPARSVS